MRTRAEIDAAMAARLEDVRWMAETGEHLDGAARRLGISTATLERFLERNDRDALSRLIARRPRDHNRLVADVSIYALTGLGERRRRQPARGGRRRQQHREAA